MLTGRSTVNHIITVLPGVPPVERKGPLEAVGAAAKTDNSVLPPWVISDGADGVTRTLQGAKGTLLGSQ
jgi:hypothetical protein